MCPPEPESLTRLRHWAQLEPTELPGSKLFTADTPPPLLSGKTHLLPFTPSTSFEAKCFDRAKSVSHNPVVCLVELPPARSGFSTLADKCHLDFPVTRLSLHQNLANMAPGVDILLHAFINWYSPSLACYTRWPILSPNSAETSSQASKLSWSKTLIDRPINPIQV